MFIIYDQHKTNIKYVYFIYIYEYNFNTSKCHEKYYNNSVITKYISKYSKYKNMNP